MARGVSNSWVCSKQQDTFSNQDVFVYSKSWKRVENGSWYKKKGKSRESNRVCRKNEESVGESSSSIKKSIEGDEVTSR